MMSIFSVKYRDMQCHGKRTTLAHLPEIQTWPEASQEDLYQFSSPQASFHSPCPWAIAGL
jgi:hypothetical protein